MAQDTLGMSWAQGTQEVNKPLDALVVSMLLHTLRVSKALDILMGTQEATDRSVHTAAGGETSFLDLRESERTRGQHSVKSSCL